MGLQTGDRVKHRGDKIGTIVIVDKGSKGCGLGVRFDDSMDGHDLNGECPHGYGWWCSEEDLELIKEKEKKEQLVDSGHDQSWACEHCKHRGKCIRGCDAHGGQYYAPDKKHPKYIEITRSGGNQSQHSKHRLTNEKGDLFKVIEESEYPPGLVCKNEKGEISVVHNKTDLGPFFEEITKAQYESRLQSKAIPRAERRADLAEEAEARGYLPGTEAKHLTSGKWCEITKTGFDFYDKSDSLYAKGEGYTVRIYKQGEWAEKREPAVKVPYKPKRPSLLKGSIYRVSYSGDDWLLEFSKWNEEDDEICGKCMTTDGQIYFEDDCEEEAWGTLNDDTTIRPATIDEMKWFMYCKEHNKFVKQKDVPSDFMHKGVAKSIKEDVICETKIKQDKDMPRGEFKEGDYVWIRPDSRYYGKSNQGGGSRGRIDSYYSSDSMTVAWENGEHNSYDHHDLTHHDPSPKPERSPRYRLYRAGEYLTLAELTLRVAGSRGGYYLDNDHGFDNEEVFKRLEISRKVDFITDLIGKDHPLNGGFPEVGNLDDLSKVISALQERQSYLQGRMMHSGSRRRSSDHEAMMRRMSEQRFHPPGHRMHFIDYPGMHSMGSGGLDHGEVAFTRKEVKAEEDDRGILITASQKKVVVKKKFKVETIKDDDIVE